MSQITIPQGQPIEIDWQLGVSDGRYKIQDVTINPTFEVKGDSFPPAAFPDPEIIQHAIWLYLRFTLSYRDVEELLAEREGPEPHRAVPAA
jgi:hypothetical protein